MGIHWYARSRELNEAEQALLDIERRIHAPDADDRARDGALEEREALFLREDEARAELERRDRAVTMDAVRGWPAHVLEHVDALGVADGNRGFLDVLGWRTDYFAGWGTNYYINNLRDAHVPMDAFSHRLEYLDVSPEQACALGEELLEYASRTPRVSDGGLWLFLRRRRSKKGDQFGRVRARQAGLWLFFWGSLDCRVEAGR